MKEVLVEEVIKKQMYEAFDGKQFTTKESCREYENNRRNIVRHLFDNIPHTEICACNLFDPSYSDNYVYIMQPRDLEDIKVINEHFMYVSYGCKDIIVNQNHIGKKIVIAICDDSEYMNNLGVLEDVINDFTSKLNDLSVKLDENN